MTRLVCDCCTARLLPGESRRGWRVCRRVDEVRCPSCAGEGSRELAALRAEEYV